MTVLNSLKNGVVKVSRLLTESLAPALPWRWSPFTSKIRTPEWHDPVYELRREGYHIIRTSPPTAKPMLKMGVSMATRQLIAVCEEDPDRAEAVQYVVDRMPGLPEMLKEAVWNTIEGVRFHNLKALPYTVNGYQIPDLRGGSRRKVAAGGNLLWDGERIVKAREPLPLQRSGNISSQEERDEKELPRDRFIVFANASASPNGESDLGIMLYLLAQGWRCNARNRDEYRERHGLPYRIVMKNIEALNAGRVPQEMQNAADKMARASQSVVAMSDKDRAEMSEPSGTTWQFLIEDERALERVASELVCLEALTSGPASSGPNTRGSAAVSEGQLAMALESLALNIAEALTDDLLPFIMLYNQHLIPGGMNGAPIHFELQQSPIEAQVTPNEALAFADKHSVDTQWLYGRFGAPVPPGTPPVIEPRQPMSFFPPGGNPPNPTVGQARASLAHCPIHGKVNLARKPGEVSILDAITDSISDELRSEFTGAFQRVAERVAKGQRPPNLPDSLAYSLAKGRGITDLAGRSSADIDAAKVGAPPQFLNADGKQPTKGSLIVDVQESMNLPFREAIKDFSSRRAIPSTTAAEVAEAYSQGAFSAMRIVREHMLETAQVKIREFLQEGRDPREFTKWLTENDPNIGEGYANMVFRTNVNEAYSAGHRKQYEAVKDSLAGWEYLTALDDSVRPEHAKLHGKIFPLDARGEMFMPPLAHNCRCTSAPVGIGEGTPITNDEYGPLAQGIPVDFLRRPGVEEYGS